MNKTVVIIDSEQIKLDQFLKLAGAVGSGSDAKFLITAGKILVNEEIELRRGRKLSNGDRVQTPEKSFIIKKESPGI